MEYIFRGKRVDTDEWVFGDLIKCISGKRYIFQSYNYANESDKVGQEGCLMILTFEVIPESVGQYIGIDDKNGVKTFSNDKIRIGGIEAEIIFKNGAFLAKSEFGEYAFEDIFNFEVIGG